MSMIIGICVEEGIVLAGDRRITYDCAGTMEEAKGKTTRGIRFKSNAQHLYICENGCVITNNGDPFIEDVPIAHYIRLFLKQWVKKDTDITEVPDLLMNYFTSLAKDIDTHFFVAGYDKTKTQQFYNVDIGQGDVQEYETDHNFALWTGERFILDKITRGCMCEDEQGNMVSLPNPAFMIKDFNLQDAIDFAKLAIETTIRFLPYFDVVPSVGDGIDVVLITENETRWLQTLQLP